MNLITFGTTIGFMVLGYLIGSWSNAIMITKFFKLGDIRKKGSGNAGATNTLRNYGKKIGMIVFILDFLKTVVACLIAYSVKEHVIISAVGVAVVIGHVYPLYFKFKGGKGAACLFGLFLTINWVIALIGVVVFFIILGYKKTASIGSIYAPIVLISLYIVLIPTQTPLSYQWAMPVVYQELWYVPLICLIAAHVLVIYKHKENIKRILNGTESKLFGSKNK